MATWYGIYERETGRLVSIATDLPEEGLREELDAAPYDGEEQPSEAQWDPEARAWQSQRERQEITPADVGSLDEALGNSELPVEDAAEDSSGGRRRGARTRD